MLRRRLGDLACAKSISNAVAVLRASTELPDVAVLKRLVSAGIEHGVAERLLILVPMVYCRVLLASSGVRFSDNFRKLLPTGEISAELPLESEPLWEHVWAFAHKEMESGPSDHDIIALAARSSEFDAVNQLLNAGTKLRNVQLTSPILSIAV